MMCTALLMTGLCSCEEIYQNKLEGTWSEQYDPFAYAMDGSVEYTFDGNGHYSLHTYDVLSGHTSDRSGDYALDLIGKNTITLNPFSSDHLSGDSYNIVLLTSDEMAWQKVGTTYSQGAWGVDYRHFVRIK